MNDERDESEYRAWLDEKFPLVAEGGPLPGGWVEGQDNNGAKTVIAGVKAHWTGSTSWRTQHGVATVYWDLGKPKDVFEALYPDGSRGRVGYTLDHGYRRRATGERQWVFGTIDIRPDDAVFVDGDQPVYEPPVQSDEPNLESDLAHDTAFRASLKDEYFARAVYKVFENREFIRIAEGARWSCGQRQAAHLVADMREQGDSYHDYYLREGLPGIWPDDRPAYEASLREQVKLITVMMPADSNSYYWNYLMQLREQLSALKNNENATIFMELRDHLTRLGWRTENDDDRAEYSRKAKAEHMRLIQEMKDLENRPTTEMPDWAAPLVNRLGGTGWAVMKQGGPADWDAMSEDEREAVIPGAVFKRLVALALSGRISRDEFEHLNSRIDNRYLSGAIT